MKFEPPILARRRHSRRAVLLIALTTLLATAATGADDLPNFEPGLWTFTISIATPGSALPHSQVLNRCTNPGVDIRKKWQALAAQSCKFSRIAHDGKRYSYSSTCQKGDIKLDMKSVITVESDKSYRVDTESRTNNQVRRESVVATRVGECAAAEGHSAVPLPRKSGSS